MANKNVVQGSKALSKNPNVSKASVQQKNLGKSSYNKLYILIPLFLTIIVYSGSLNNGWIKNWDDGGYVTEVGSNNSLSAKNIHKLTGENLNNVFTTFYKGNYHPLTTLFYAFEYRAVGDSPFLYHLINLLIHLINVYLVFIFLKLLTKRVEIAAITAALFGIHPMHVESVAWVSELKDVMYTFFFLISMIQYFYYFTRKEKKTKYYTFSLIALVLSLLSKSAAVTLPVVLLLIDYYFGRKWAWKIIYEKIPFFLASIIFGLTAIFSQGSAKAIQDLDPLYSIPERLLLACGASFTYIWKLFVPVDLSAMYPYPDRIGGFLPVIFYVAPAVVLLIVGLVYYSRKFNRDIIFGSLFFIITISLVLQLLPVGGALLAERYTYIPYIGFFLIIGKGYVFSQEGQSSFAKSIRKVYPVVLIAGTIVWSVMAFQRIATWKDGKVLFTDVIKKYPNLPFAYNNRGYFNFSFGEEYYKDVFKKAGYMDAKSMAYDSALADYNKCITIDSTFHRGLSNRGVLYYNLAENAKKNGTITDQKVLDSIYNLAAVDFTKALKLSSDNTDALIGRANTYSTLKEFRLSLPDYNEYIKRVPDDKKAYLWRGTAHYNVGDYEPAFNDFNNSVQMDPGNDDAFLWRGICYYQKKDYKSAVVDFDQSLKLNAEQSEPYSWRGLANYSLKKLEDAVSDYNSAIVMNPKDAAAYINRSQAYYELGKYEQAFSDQCSAGDLGYALNKEFFFKLKALAGK
ncbi:MAG: tetratricopeptide repeat protein [Bacteroidota bacterium]